jgi:glycosyltransferase involved in cell wall biosynthesis
MSNRSHRLAILSAWPPPYGGVTVHTLRLSALLRCAEIDHRVYNAVSNSEAPGVESVHRFRRSWLLRYLFAATEDSIYIMSPRLSMWLAGAFLNRCRHKRVLIRIRNARICEWAEKPGWRRQLAAFALRRVNGVVCVSAKIADTVRGLGVNETNIHTFPGFLPPAESERHLDSLSNPIREFISNHHPLLVANGKVSQFQGEDLYGIDMITDLAVRLQADFPRLGIAVSLSDNKPTTNRYLAKQAAIAHRGSAGNHLLFNTEPGPLLPLLAKADLFLRPTNTDGDANSVREALYYGLPVVASDAAQRPEGSTLFVSRDMDDFEKKVRTVLTEMGKEKSQRTGETEIDRSAAEYLSVIRDQLKV